MNHAFLPLPVRILLPGIALLVLLATALAGPDRARAAETTCPATFHVLHDDRVGKLKLHEGHYEITLLNDRHLSCTDASDLFRQFLEDFDGKLPGRWVVLPARSEFVQGGTDIGFRVRRVSNPSGGGGGRHPASGTHCPSYFQVLHNDTIGRLRLPAGEYRITLISAGRLTCERASQLFAKFLQDWDGDLPGRWRADVATATFSKNRQIGFRVKRAVGPAPNPNGGGGVHPARSHERCPGKFRVLHDDRIGKLRLKEGNYRITLLQRKGLTCQRASSLLTRFLEDYSGDLPGKWRVNRQNAAFRKGAGGKGFRIKLVR